MGVIGGGAHHRVDVLLLEAFSPVRVGLGLREPPRGLRKGRRIDVAERHDVLAAHAVEIGAAPSPYPDDGDIELVVGRLGGRKKTGRKDRQSGPDGFPLI